MSNEIRPVGVACNLGCTYCYETSLRNNRDNAIRYNKNVVMEKIDKVTGQWSLFGGEPLLLPLREVDELLQKGFERFKQTGVQTNGTLITPEHIEVFTKWRTYVGISVDGPEELNDSRWAGTEEATRKLTAKSHWAIERLAELSKEPGKEFLVPSIIVTLHAGNASKDRWPKMKQWLQHLDDIGIRYLNIHVMEMDAQANEWYLPTDELVAVMTDIWNMVPTFKNLKVANFGEYLDLLKGNDQKAMCVWHACDPWNTSAVQGLEGDGSPSHCSRTNKDGIDWLPSEGSGVATEHAFGGFAGNRHHERQLSLYVTPQADGGCKDCEFWMMCMGQCPGTGEQTDMHKEGDWRLRSTYCDFFKGMFREAERRLVSVGEQPVTLWKNRKQLEERMYELWSQGYEPYMSRVIEESKGPKPLAWSSSGNRDHGNGHGDHTDSAPKGDRPHGDSHGDEHGDHTDASKVS